MKTLLNSLHFRLAPRDEEWFKGGWRTFDGELSYFNEAFNPEQTLTGGANVWGGQMLPDTFPILGDGSGNCLCVRFGSDGMLSEIVAWDHEGGHWRHYGYSIDQALVLNQVEYGLSEEQTGEHPVTHTKLSPVALNETECKRALKSRLEIECRLKGGRKIANLVGVSWKELAMWLPDTSLIPQEKVERIADALHVKPADLTFQNWATAIEQAQLVLNLRNDLAWPYAVIGWAYERKGQLDEAIGFYKKGVMTLGSSSAFTETWTRNPEDRRHKFAAQRLRVLSNSGMEQEVQEYVTAKTLSEIRTFWLAKAKAATERHDHASAYHYLYFAGWDSLFTNEMKNILESMTSSAQKAGFPALAALAALHLNSIQRPVNSREVR